jgi:hypothetical protein
VKNTSQSDIARSKANGQETAGPARHPGRKSRNGIILCKESAKRVSARSNDPQ